MNNKRINSIISIILVAILVSVVFIIIKRNDKKINDTSINSLEKPTIDIIEIRKKVRGKVVPAELNNVKSQISGVVEQLNVKLGDQILKGQVIARIKVVPSPDEISEAERNVQMEELNYQLDKKLYEKNKGLYQSGGTSLSKVEEIKAQMEISKLKYDAEFSRLNALLKSNYSPNNDRDISIVYSNYSGTVLEIPVTIGESITKRTSNTEGTTIAKIANMDSLKFEGKINENDIKALKSQMKIHLIINALNNECVDAYINEISPVATNENGINKFKFNASLMPGDLKVAYSGISATADILFEKTDSVLCIKEKYLQYEDEKIFVEINKNGDIVRKDLTIGLSDGEKIEIVSGLKMYHSLVLPNWDEE